MRRLGLSILVGLTLIGCKKATDQNSTTPKSPNAVKQRIDFSEANRLGEQERFVEAINVVQRQITDETSQNDKCLAFTMIGNCYINLKRFDIALTFYDKALDCDPNSYRAFEGKGIAYDWLKDHVEAKKNLLKALDLAPDDSSIQMRLGEVAIHQGDFETAIRYIRRALESEGSDRSAGVDLAALLTLVGRLDEAELELHKVPNLGVDKRELLKLRIEDFRDQR